MNEQNKPLEKVVEVVALKKDFLVGTQQVSVLKEVTFDLNRGEFAVIIGASGSGKSTLLHTLLGLEPPTDGIVKILGTEIYLNTVEDDRSVFRKKHIGMVYQQPNWIRSLTVLENVAFPLILLGIEKAESTKRAWEAIYNVGMREWTNYKPTELSGGQQQKVALARALVINPEIIVADEPTGNLDYESGKNLMEMLVSLNKEGRTIIMVTHDLEYLKYCNTAVKIKDGKVFGVYRDGAISEVIKDTSLSLKKFTPKEETQEKTKEIPVKKDTSINRIKAQAILSKVKEAHENTNIEEPKSTEVAPTIHTPTIPVIEVNKEDSVKEEPKNITTKIVKETQVVEPKEENINKEPEVKTIEEPKVVEVINNESIKSIGMEEEVQENKSTIESNIKEEKGIQNTTKPEKKKIRKFKKPKNKSGKIKRT